jgi:hypothetical protein
MRLAFACILIFISLTTVTSAQSDAPSIQGIYNSDAFAPRPLILTVTGIGPDGTVVGEMRGMREDRSAWWTQKFGAPGSWIAQYRNGELIVVANSKVRYQLHPTASGLAGNYFDPPNDRPLTFQRPTADIYSQYDNVLRR